MLHKTIYALVVMPMLLLANIGYVANYGSDTVSVFNTQTQKAFKTIAVGKQPHGTWLSESNSHLYVANMGSHTISIIDTSTNKRIKDISVGLAPVELVSANGFIYTADSKSNTVSIVDEKTFTLIKKLSVGIQPEGMERSKDGDTIYVSNSKSKTITVIDTKKQIVTRNISIPSDAHNLRLSSDEKKLYVTSPSAHKVIVIDTNTLKLSGEIALEKTSNPVELLTNNSYIFVSCVNDGTLYKIDANTHKITSKLTLGGELHGLASYKENKIILSHSSENTLAFINVDNMALHAKMNVGQDPRGTAIIATFDPANNATQVSINQNLILTLNEPINIMQPAGVLMSLYKTSDDSIVETFNISTNMGSSGGSSTILGQVLTLNPNANLAYSTSYYIQSTAPVRNIDTLHTDYVINDKITWTFTTESAPTPAPVSTPADKPKPRIKHKVTIGDVVTEATSLVKPKSVVKLKNGNLRTVTGHVDAGDGYYFTAVIETIPEGQSTVAIYKISETDPTDVALISPTYTNKYPFPLGSTIVIQEIDEKLYIIINSPLGSEPLIVQ